jgi:hypothetical protein
MISSRVAFDHAHFVAVKSIPLSLRSAQLPAIGQRSAFLHLEEFLTKFAQAHCGVEAKRFWGAPMAERLESARSTVAQRPNKQQINNAHDLPLAARYVLIKSTC